MAKFTSEYLPFVLELGLFGAKIIGLDAGKHAR